MTNQQPVLAFLHIPKTGGTTMTTILRSVYWLRHCHAIRTGPASSKTYGKRELEAAFRLYPALRVISGHPMRPHVDFGEYGERLRWATVLRDPVERLYSGYRYACVTKNMNPTFADWCADHGKPNIQVNWIAGAPDVDKAKALLDDFFWVGDLGDLDTSLAMLAARLDNPRFPTSTNQVFNKTPDIGEGYDRALALEYNALDVELYDHFRRVIWPRQLAAPRPDYERPFTDDTWAKLRRSANRAYHVGVYKPVQKRIAKRPQRS